MGQAKEPLIRIPFKNIQGLPPRAQQEIRRNFDELARGIRSSAAFIIVASDGTGDFTSIAAAIASLPTTPTTVSYLIYVKQSVSAYDDSATTVPLNGRNVTIWGQEGSVRGALSTTVTSAPVWTLPNTGITAGTSGSVIRLVNMSVACASSANPVFPTSGSGVDHTADRCVFATLYGVTSPPGIGVFNQCSIATVYANSTDLQTAEFNDCRIGLLFASGITVTATGSTVHWRLVDSRVTSQTVPATISFSSAGVNRRFEILNTSFLNGSSTLTFSGFVNSEQVSIIGCTGGWPNLTFSLGSAAAVNLILDGNNLPGCVITVAEAAGAQHEAIRIAGSYGSIVCAATGAQIDALLSLRGTTGQTALTISGNNCIANIGVVEGTTSTGVNVSGNNNIIWAPNITACTTPSVDTGSGNSINATGISPLAIDTHRKDMVPGELFAPLPGVNTIPAATGTGGAPSGPAGGSLGGTYPNPNFAGRDSSVDALNKDLLPSALGGDPSGVSVVNSYPAGVGGVTVGDADYTATPFDRHIEYQTALTALRTVTLAFPNTVPQGTQVTISDFGAITGGFGIKIVTPAFSTINGTTSTRTINQKSGWITLESNGNTKWTIVGFSDIQEVDMNQSFLLMGA